MRRAALECRAPSKDKIKPGTFVPAKVRATNQQVCVCRRGVFPPSRRRAAMRGSLGEKIGQGESADIHAWAPGQVVKLFKTGVEQRLSRHEARMTRAAFAAGLPAPEVFDE